MIKLIEDLYFNSDERNFMLVSWNGKTDKNGKLIGARNSYFSDYDSLLRGVKKVLQLRAMNTANTLQELVTQNRLVLDKLDEISKLLTI
jgi:hypothetical protein